MASWFDSDSGSALGFAFTGSTLSLASLAGVALVCALALGRLWHVRARARKGLRDPPGPPRHFLLGNLLDMPKHDYHLGYARLAEQYGPVMQFTLPTRKMVMLSTAKAAEDLLMKRGAVYADRPPLPMQELIGWVWTFGLQRHGDAWRARRKILHQHLNARVIGKYSGLQSRTALIFARKLLLQPTELAEHIKWATAANVMHAAYGLDIALEHDPLVELEAAAVESFSREFVPGKYLVDTIPALKYIPEWFPGGGFKKIAREGRKLSDAVADVPFERAKQELAHGSPIPSIVSESLTHDVTKEDEIVIKEAVGVMYFAGADTTVSALMTFFLEMVRHPEMQRKAQTELDRVLGNDRLPTFADREALPYIEALIREVFRMYPVAPLGIPHAAREDDVYEGMIINKDTEVFANIWAILHDPAAYPNPHVFDPERFLKDGKVDQSVMDPRTAFFGYGHRICPGAHFADTTIFIIVATALTCYNFDQVVVDGARVVPGAEFDHGFFSLPRPFQCDIKPRSGKVEGWISQGLEVVY